MIAERSRTKSDEDTRRPANHRTRNNGVGPNSKQQQENKKVNHEREKIVFLVLTISVAALVVVACFRFNVISKTSDGRVTKRIPIPSNRMGEQESRKDQIKADPAKIEKIFLFFDHKFVDETYVSRNGSVRLEMEDFEAYADDDGEGDYYYRFDDDYERNPFSEERWIKEGHQYIDDDEEAFCCRRISEHRLSFPNCNTFHETPILESKASIIGYDFLHIFLSFECLADTFHPKNAHVVSYLNSDCNATGTMKGHTDKL